MLLLRDEEGRYNFVHRGDDMVEKILETRNLDFEFLRFWVVRCTIGKRKGRHVVDLPTCCVQACVGSYHLRKESWCV